MALTKDKKQQVIDDVAELLGGSKLTVVAAYQGTTVKAMQQLRRDLRSKGAELHVLKNTLFRIAAGDDVNNVPAEYHNGTTAFAFVYENEPDVAKALLDFARTSKKLVVKGGLFGGKPMTDKQVQTLSELPSKEVLISQIIGLVASPLTDLVSVIEALYADPIRVIGAVADKVAEGAGAEAAPATEETSAPAADAAPAPEEISEAPASTPETTENA